MTSRKADGAVKKKYQLGNGNESEGTVEYYYDMTAGDSNGEWNLDAMGNSGHRCTKCGVGNMVQACVMRT